MSQVIEMNGAAENFPLALEATTRANVNEATMQATVNEATAQANVNEATMDEVKVEEAKVDKVKVDEAKADEATGGLSLEALREQVAEGFIYSHSRENANTSKVLEVASFSYALVELLSERGVISIEELDERKKQVGKRLVEKFTETGIGVALTDDDRNKYDYASSVEVDCASRLELCRGACCRLKFALTVQDLEEGKVKWDLGRPYMIRHNAEGYCYHIEAGSKRCTIYDERPVVCRSYDCRRDARIWTDYENRVINPELENLFPKSARASAANETANETAGEATRPLYQLSRTRAEA